MHKTWSHLTRAALLGGLVFLAACSGPQLKLEPIPVTANPTDEATKLETELVNARQQQVNVLAPSWYGKAEASLAEAKRIIAQKGDIGGIGDNVSRGRAELAKAQEMAKISRTAIPEAIKGRDLARVAGATVFGQDYADVEAGFLDLTREIEDNNLSYAQRNQQKVVDAFRAIEIRAIKETTLGEVRKLLEQAEKEGAKKLAPEVLAEAQKELRDVDAFISANPYAKEEMHHRAYDVLFQAKRLVQLTRQSERFRKMEPIQVALWAEGVLQQTSAKLGAADMRDQPFDTQVENILGTAGSLKADREFVSEKMKGQQAEIDTLKKQQQEEVNALRQQHATEVSTLTAKYDGEVGDLLKKVASLEGKSREEQSRLVRLLADQRAEREKGEAAQRAEQERLAAEKRAAEEKLAAERKFNEQYNQVQGLFNKEEAETYKQGQQMVLRLRGMSFPVGQSLIMPDNYALLSKVQNAIRTFANPDITIEGHTDSTGALEMNNHLSQQRAEAVREYLLANGVTTADKAAAVGYGPSRPLAPNTTAEGRAQNRRIDVIITPKGQAAQ
ncbi:MAG: OmpA family protein [Proteobacteria bacterium]|nr:OmpA family protein [Pseudomonadota bacterium]